MARTYGAVYLDIWRDKDFRRLSHTEQYVYWALIFQPKLNRAGLLDYMPDRWAEATGDMTTADVEVTIKSLAAKRYVVVDDATHELLIRTYVRNSEVWRMPKAFASVIPAAKEIQSSRLRHVLLADLDKIRLEELSDAPGANDGPSVRAKIDAYLEKLRAVLDDGEPDDPAGIDGSGSGSEHGYDADAERVSVPNEYGTDTEGVASGTRVRAQAVPLPVPVQVPVPSSVVRETGTGAQLSLVPGLPADEPSANETDESEPAALFDTPAVEIPSQRKPESAKKTPGSRAKAKPKVFTTAPETFEITAALAQWALTEHKLTRQQVEFQTPLFLDHHRAKGSEFKDWNAAWRTWMGRVNQYAPRGSSGSGTSRQELGGADHMARFRTRQEALAYANTTQPIQQPELEVFPWDRTS